MGMRVLYTIITFLFIALLSTLVILYAKGYSLNLKKGSLDKTGILLIKSIPDGAKIILADTSGKGEKLVDVTNTSIANLEPKGYKVRLEKEGHHTWVKEVPVKEELVTEIDALLISRTPTLVPLTSTGVRNPTFSNSGESIVYYTSSKGKSGLWFLSFFNPGAAVISKNIPRLIANDSSTENFGESRILSFSPDNDEILVSLKKEKEERYYLLSTERLNTEPLESQSSAETILNLWKEEKAKRRKQLVEKLLLEPKIKEITLKEETLWSPNQTKFLYFFEESNEIEYRVYNAKKPLGVGEQPDNKVLRTNKDRELKFTWHSDNKHLIIVEEKEINLIEIDGYNQTQVFSGPLYSQEVYSTQDGRGLIILTTFSSFDEPNFYMIRLN